MPPNTGVVAESSLCSLAFQACLGAKDSDTVDLIRTGVNGQYVRVGLRLPLGPQENSIRMVKNASFLLNPLRPSSQWVQ